MIKGLNAGINILTFRPFINRHARAIPSIEEKKQDLRTEKNNQISSMVSSLSLSLSSLFS